MRLHFTSGYAISPQAPISTRLEYEAVILDDQGDVVWRDVRSAWRHANAGTVWRRAPQPEVEDRVRTEQERAARAKLAELKGVPTT